MIGEEEFKGWLLDPVTVAVKELLGKKREAMRQAWEGGSFTDYDKNAMILVNVGNLGTCRGYAFVMELDYESFITEVDDGESFGAKAPGSSGAH